MLIPTSPFIRELSKLMHYRSSAQAGFDPGNPLYVRETATGWIFAPHRSDWWRAFQFYLCILVTIVFVTLTSSKWSWSGALLGILAAWGGSVLLAYASIVRKELEYDRNQQSWTFTKDRARITFPIGAIHKIRVEEVVYHNAQQLPTSFAPQILYYSAEGELLSIRLGVYTFQPQALAVVYWLTEQAQAVAPFMKLEHSSSEATNGATLQTSWPFMMPRIP
jgi:hypothetical protein